MRRAAQSLSPTSWPRCGSASKRSLRSAPLTSPLALNGGPIARVDPHAPARSLSGLLHYDVVTCLFSPDFYLMRSAVRDWASSS